MAAAIIAAKDRLNLSGHLAEDPLVDCLPRDHVIKDGVLGRQAMSVSGISWPARRVVLTEEGIYFGKVDTLKLIDFVPLVEVDRLEAIDHEQKMIRKKRLLSRSGKAGPSVTGDGKAPTHTGADKYAVFVIRPIEGGMNSGRPVVLQAVSHRDMHGWMDSIHDSVAKAKIKLEKSRNRIDVWQDHARRFYESDKMQYLAGIMIFASYFTSILDSQLQPEKGSVVESNLFIMEILFTVIFTLELLLNMFGSWFWRFFTDTWNLIDLFVVATSIVAVLVEEMPAVNFLRLIRVCRMVKLVRKLTTLRILINALISSIIPVLYSFVILLLVSSLYAIAAATLFKADGENFGNFGKSLFSLFQMATGDSWASQIARGVIGTLLHECTTTCMHTCTSASVDSLYTFTRIHAARRKGGRTCTSRVDVYFLCLVHADRLCRHDEYRRYVFTPCSEVCFTL